MCAQALTRVGSRSGAEHRVGKGHTAWPKGTGPWSHKTGLEWMLPYWLEVPSLRNDASSLPSV